MRNIWNRMMSVSKSTQIAQVYGTFIALGLIVYFFLMYAVGLVHVVELRLLNIFILLAGVYYAMKQFRRTNEGYLDYFRAMVLGVTTAFVAASTFTVFLFIYMNIDQNIMNLISTKKILGRPVGPYVAAFAVWFEGIFSGFFVSYLFSNFMSTDTPGIDRSSDNVARRLHRKLPNEV